MLNWLIFWRLLYAIIGYVWHGLSVSLTSKHSLKNLPVCDHLYDIGFTDSLLVKLF